MALTIQSTDFEAGGEIPRVHTCEGDDISPALAWSGVPAGTQSLALVVEDPDAPDPDAPRTTWAHWVVYNIPPATAGLPRGAGPGHLPPGARAGVNDWKRPIYNGPCPPVGRHRYFHRLFALDTVLADLGQPTRTALLGAIKGHVIEAAELMGTYQKGRL